MTLSCITIDDLPEFEFKSGTYQVLIFDVVDSNGGAVNLNASTCTWRLAQYGQSTSLLTKTGVVSGSPINRITVTLNETDTIGFSGKYKQQYKVIDFSGKVFIPSQGNVHITPGII